MQEYLKRYTFDRIIKIISQWIEEKCDKYRLLVEIANQGLIIKTIAV